MGDSLLMTRKDGKELFYVEGDSLMAVSVATSPKLTIGFPSEDPVLFLESPEIRSYVTDWSSDGNRLPVAFIVSTEKGIAHTPRGSMLS